jgi:hypothetical protein
MLEKLQLRKLLRINHPRLHSNVGRLDLLDRGLESVTWIG